MLQKNLATINIDKNLLFRDFNCDEFSKEYVIKPSNQAVILVSNNISSTNLDLAKNYR